MQQGLTNPKTLEQIQQLVDNLFSANSLHDSIVYQLATTLCMPKFYKFMHYSIAHIFGELADDVTDFGILRNDVFHRGSLEANDKEYNNVVECLQTSYDSLINIQKQVEVCIDSAIETNDKAYEDFLRDFNFNKICLYIKQIRNLLEGSKSYDSSGILPLFNDQFESYIVLPENLIKR